MAPRKKKKDETETPGAGHNSGAGVAAQELRQFIERIERLQEEKQTVQDDINDVFGEAKGRGYDVKAIKAILKERKQDRNELMEFESIVDTYRAALGMLPKYEDDPMEREDDDDTDSSDDNDESMV